MKYLIISVSDYKGGELGEPMIYDSLQDLIHSWDYGLEDLELGTRESFEKEFKEAITDYFGRDYAYDESKFSVYKITKHFNLTSISPATIIKNINFNELWNFHKEQF